MPLELVRSDITTMSVDAVVNAANSSLVPGGGVCGAIFAAAGYEEMDRACRAIGHCDVGQAVLTRGFRLPARYVIHAVGPVWQGGGNGEAALLRQCYLSALDVARRARCESVAFPLISSGIFGYPKGEALRIAVGAIGDFLLEHEMQVYLVVFDKKALALSERLYAGVSRYIDDHYVESSGYARRLPAEHQARTRQLLEQEAVPPERAAMPLVSAAPRPVPAKRSLKDLLGRLDESFSRMLLRLIDEKGMTDVEVYKRANLDRKLFSKIRREDYKPSKPTAIALAIALRLNLDETRDLLASAGYALSHSSKFDVIVEYFIQEGVYDIYEINETLFAFDQRTLGA